MVEKMLAVVRYPYVWLTSDRHRPPHAAGLATNAANLCIYDTTCGIGKQSLSSSHSYPHYFPRSRSSYHAQQHNCGRNHPHYYCYRRRKYYLQHNHHKKRTPETSTYDLHCKVGLEGSVSKLQRIFLILVQSYSQS